MPPEAGNRVQQISEGKLILSEDGDKVIYHDKLNPANGKNFETYDALEFLAALSTHIPARNRKVVIYYGWYSQPARGKRRREGRLTTGRPITSHQVECDNKKSCSQDSRSLSKIGE